VNVEERFQISEECRYLNAVEAAELDDDTGSSTSGSESNLSVVESDRSADSEDDNDLTYFGVFPPQSQQSRMQLGSNNQRK
jgi:hypothetical protein